MDPWAWVLVGIAVGAVAVLAATKPRALAALPEALVRYAGRVARRLAGRVSRAGRDGADRVAARCHPDPCLGVWSSRSQSSRSSSRYSLCRFTQSSGASRGDALEVDRHGRNHMEHRNFGNTDLSCSVVGFGTWEMGGTQYGDIDLKAAVRAVEMAVDHGITLFDTAEVYGPFTSGGVACPRPGRAPQGRRRGHQGRIRLPRTTTRAAGQPSRAAMPLPPRSPPTPRTACAGWTPTTSTCC